MIVIFFKLKVLTSLLHKQSPATEADLIRELACRALNGVARFEPIRQILSKLPIIAANELNGRIFEFICFLLKYF